ncbi:MAG: alpha/beta hydrolase [Bacteroidetes bacterium]|nr:alpha/beta hydrolase [Bacteroidota bacterium]
MIRNFFVILFTGLGLITWNHPSFSQDTVLASSRRPFENSHFQKVDSATFHYRVFCKDTLNVRGKVLLVHGFCGSTFCWRKNIDTLVRSGYLVVAIDLPGFGYSDRNLHVNQSQSSRAHMIWLLLTHIDKGDKRKWNIVGHSMGGGAVEAMALMNPDRVQTVTLVDGMVFIRNQNLKGTFVAMSKMQGYNEVLVSLTKQNVISYHSMARLMKGVYGRPLDSAEMKGYMDPLRIDGSAASVINIFANAHEIRHLHADGLMDLPVLLIWGKKDKTIRIKSAKKLKRNVPTIDLKIISDAYHSPMETTPQEFNALLLDFFNSHN